MMNGPFVDDTKVTEETVGLTPNAEDVLACTVADGSEAVVLTENAALGDERVFVPDKFPDSVLVSEATDEESD